MGTGNITDIVDGTVADATDLNQYSAALKQDLVPRTSVGLATDSAGSLGQSSLRWLKGWFASVGIGVSSSNNTIEEDGSNNVIVKRDGSTVAEFASDGVSREYFGTLNQVTSSGSGFFSHTGLVETAVTNMSVTITTNGKPVRICLICDPVSGSSLGSSSFTASTQSIFYIYRDSTLLTQEYVGSGLSSSAATYNEVSLPVGSIATIDIPSAGTYVYKLTTKSLNSGTTSKVSNAKLMAYEL